MKNKLFLGLCLISAFAIASCKKNSVLKPPTDPVETKKDTDVYVCGFIINSNGKPIAVYWKNGVLTKLADDNSNSKAEAITIFGNDVYISGQTTVNTQSYGPQAVYWKNGVLHTLTDSLYNSRTNSDALAIAVKDDKVYTAGYTSGTVTIATSWENGGDTNALFDGQDIPTGSQATGIVFKGNDLYIVGSIKDNNINLNYNAAYWRNGALKYLPKTRYTNSEANAVCIKGDDVYIAGHDFDMSSYHALSVFWKNEIPTETYAQPLPAAYASRAYAIAADSTSNVYVAGISHRKEGSNQAVYWKNTQQFNLMDSSKNSAAFGIAISGNNIFVVGYDFSASQRAVLWKNGILTNLSESESQASGIAVVIH